MACIGSKLFEVYTTNNSFDVEPTNGFTTDGYITSIIQVNDQLYFSQGFRLCLWNPTLNEISIVFVSNSQEQIERIAWNGDDKLYLSMNDSYILTEYNMKSGAVEQFNLKEHTRLKWKIRDIAVDNQNNVYIIESKGHYSICQLRKITLRPLSSTLIKTNSTSHFYLHAICYGRENNTLYVCTSNQVFECKDDTIVSDDVGWPSLHYQYVRRAIPMKNQHVLILTTHTDAALVLFSKNTREELNVRGIPEKIKTITEGPSGSVLVGFDNEVFKIEPVWKWKRLLWIGHVKENPDDCVLATVPRDIIKVISSWLGE